MKSMLLIFAAALLACMPTAVVWAEDDFCTLRAGEEQAYENFTKNLVEQGTPEDVAICMSRETAKNLSPDFKIMFLIDMNRGFFNRSEFSGWFVAEMGRKYESYAAFMEAFRKEEAQVIAAARSECGKSAGQP